MKNILAIHHSADFDGLFCREIARKNLGDNADYIGWDYGDPSPLPDGPTPQKIYMLDISVPELMNHSGLIWIDHHKTAIEKYPGVPGYQIDGVAACRLAWQYFSTTSRDPMTFALPDKQAFIDRTVTEPLAVRLAGEYDIWDRRDYRAELFQHGLRSRDLANDWALLLQGRHLVPIAEVERMMDAGFPIDLAPDGTVDPTVSTVEGLLHAGRAVQYAKTHENESIAKHNAFTIDFEGLKFCAINAARYNSHLFTAAIQPYHDALFGFNYDGPNKLWKVSLYHAPGKEHHDLSKIAAKYGGGGHRGACGFKAKSLPFLA